MPLEQYRVPANKRDGGPGYIHVGTFNAVTHSHVPYEELLANNEGMVSRIGEVGDMIIELVGVIRERPVMGYRPIPFVVGDVYKGRHDSKWRLLDIRKDRMVFEGIHESGNPGIPLFTKLDGSPWRQTTIQINPKVEQVQVGVEKYVDKENI